MARAFRALITILIITLVCTILMTTISMASVYTALSEIRLANGYGEYTIEDLLNSTRTEENGYLQDSSTRSTLLDDILDDIRGELQDSAIEQSTGTINPGAWEPGTLNPSEIQDLTDTAEILVSAIRTIGIVVSVVILLVLGIKYMVGSTSERAEYKKSMIPYLIGAVLFFALSQILGVIITAVESIS